MIAVSSIQRPASTEILITTGSLKAAYTVEGLVLNPEDAVLVALTLIKAYRDGHKDGLALRALQLG